MSLSPAAIARIATRRDRELNLVKAEMDRQFEYLEDRRLYIRRMDVARAIAPFVGREPERPLLDDVLIVARALGWKVNKTANRRLFKGVKPRRLSLRDAVRESRQLFAAIGRRPPAARPAAARQRVQGPRGQQ